MPLPALVSNTVFVPRHTMPPVTEGVVDFGGREAEPVLPGSHFTWGELTRTSQTELQAANRVVPVRLLPAARALVRDILEPIRARFGPVHVHSAYRSPALNAATPGSSETSQHMKFEAADIHVGGSLRELFDWIRTSSIPFGQVLLESRGSGPPTWVHVSLGEPWRPRSRSRQAGIKVGDAPVRWITEGAPAALAVDLRPFLVTPYLATRAAAELRGAQHRSTP